jgi:D-glycero-D-manno-heptose 1,7-bisphosphate phosphatase
MKHRAVFFDRDGTLMEEVNYCKDPKDVALIPGAAEALTRLKKKGFKNVIITNQSGIGRGWVTLEQFGQVQAALLERLGEGNVDATYFCPDRPDQESTRRKPLPGMVLEAAEEHGIDLGRSFFVGDTASDIGCGRNAGVHTVLVRTGHGMKQGDCGADHAADSVGEAVEYILRISEP